MITTAEKIRCIEREIALRMNVYPKRVAAKRMNEKTAKHELAVMRAILADYQRREQAERLL